MASTVVCGTRCVLKLTKVPSMSKNMAFMVGLLMVLLQVCSYLLGVGENRLGNVVGYK